MDSQIRIKNLEEIRHAIQDKEHELSELDLILADYQNEYSRLICELRQMRAQLYDEEEKVSSISESKHTDSLA
ncbi:MAG: hypothetical protein ACM3H7_01275 [Acidobacteriaceae bacterium]